MMRLNCYWMALDHRGMVIASDAMGWKYRDIPRKTLSHFCVYFTKPDGTVDFHDIVPLEGQTPQHLIYRRRVFKKSDGTENEFIIVGYPSHKNMSVHVLTPGLSRTLELGSDKLHDVEYYPEEIEWRDDLCQKEPIG